MGSSDNDQESVKCLLWFACLFKSGPEFPNMSPTSKRGFRSFRKLNLTLSHGDCHWWAWWPGGRWASLRPEESPRHDILEPCNNNVYLAFSPFCEVTGTVQSSALEHVTVLSNLASIEPNRFFIQYSMNYLTSILAVPLFTLVLLFEVWLVFRSGATRIENTLCRRVTTTNICSLNETKPKLTKSI